MMAVQTANVLNESGVISFLCVTRNEGPLVKKLNDEVGYIFLNKKSTIDFFAIRKLVSFIKRNDIGIMHAHSSSFFIAWVVKFLKPKLKLIWHDHYGNSEFLYGRKLQPLKFCSKWFDSVAVVNSKLLEWGSLNLKCKRIELLNNYAQLDFSTKETILKGENNKRIVYVAGFRPQKNHLLLLEAFRKKVHLEWTLHLIGNIGDQSYFNDVELFIEQNELEDKIFIYHGSLDIGNILSQSTIGVLSSSSEGLPVALLEYGLAGLPIIATDVGEVSRVIDKEYYGIIIPSNDVNGFAESLETLILDNKKRLELSKSIQAKIKNEYSSNNYLATILNLYSVE